MYVFFSGAHVLVAYSRFGDYRLVWLVRPTGNTKRGCSGYSRLKESIDETSSIQPRAVHMLPTKTALSDASQRWVTSSPHRVSQLISRYGKPKNIAILSDIRSPHLRWMCSTKAFSSAAILCSVRKPAAIASRNNTHRHPPPLTTPALWLIAGRAYDPDTAGIYVRTYAMPEPTYIRTYVRIRIINSDDDDDDGYDDDDSDDDHYVC